MAVTTGEASRGANEDVQLALLDMLTQGTPAGTIIESLRRSPAADPTTTQTVQELAKLMRESAQRREASRDQAYWMASVRRTLARIQRLARVPAIGAAEFFADYYAQNRPVFIERADAAGGDFSWTFASIRDAAGDAFVDVMRDRSAGQPEHVDPAAHSSSVRLGDYIDEITTVTTNEIYLTAANRAVRGPLRHVVEDYRPLEGVLNYEPSAWDVSLWMGPKGAITPLHYDKTNVMVVALLGTKRVTLISPFDECFLAHDDGTLTSPVDPNDVEGGPVPLARFATPCSIDVRPGSALFVPVGWWHHVESLEPSFSMSVSSFTKPNVFPATLY
jgi:hypothetical protein